MFQGLTINTRILFFIISALVISNTVSAEVISSPVEQADYIKQGFASQESRSSSSNFVTLQLKMIDFPFTLQYPGNWYVREERYVSGSSVQNPSLFISREPIKSPADQFKVGMSLIYYQNYFLSREPADTTLGKTAKVVLRAVDWDKEKIRIVDSVKSASKNVISESDIVITSQPAIKIESYTGKIHQISVYIKLNNNLITIILEAPSSEFGQYKETFEKMLESFMFTR